MSTIKVDSIVDQNDNELIANINSADLTFNNLQPNVIERDGSDSGLALLTLDSPNEVHCYYSSSYSDEIYLRSSVVSDAIYEVIWFTGKGSGNYDMRFKPNGTEYSGEFPMTYYSTGGYYNRLQQTQSSFYFDHFQGSTGGGGMGRFVFNTGANYKYCQYEGADDTALCHGYGRWTNDSRTWSWIGTLNFNQNANDKYVFCRRIG